jgi:hypothetical protein
MSQRAQVSEIVNGNGKCVKETLTRKISQKQQPKGSNLEKLGRWTQIDLSSFPLPFFSFVRTLVPLFNS